MNKETQNLFNLANTSSDISQQSFKDSIFECKNKELKNVFKKERKYKKIEKLTSLEFVPQSDIFLAAVFLTVLLIMSFFFQDQVLNYLFGFFIFIITNGTINKITELKLNSIEKKKNRILSKISRENDFIDFSNIKSSK